MIIYLGLCWAFAAAGALLELQRSWGAVRCCERASHCVGFLFRSWGLEHRLSSGARAQRLRSRGDRPRSGGGPVARAWAGGFFTAELPEKPESLTFMFAVLFP